jgi:hypothetical protein
MKDWYQFFERLEVHQQLKVLVGKLLEDDAATLRRVRGAEDGRRTAGVVLEKTPLKI